jgi:hypothetical protein
MLEFKDADLRKLEEVAIRKQVYHGRAELVRKDAAE